MERLNDFNKYPRKNWHDIYYEYRSKGDTHERAAQGADIWFPSTKQSNSGEKLLWLSVTLLAIASIVSSFSESVFSSRFERLEAGKNFKPCTLWECPK